MSKRKKKHVWLWGSIASFLVSMGALFSIYYLEEVMLISEEWVGFPILFVMGLITFLFPIVVLLIKLCRWVYARNHRKIELVDLDISVCTDASVRSFAVNSGCCSAVSFLESGFSYFDNAYQSLSNEEEKKNALRKVPYDRLQARLLRKFDRFDKPARYIIRIQWQDDTFENTVRYMEIEASKELLYRLNRNGVDVADAESLIASQQPLIQPKGGKTFYVRGIPYVATVLLNIAVMAAGFGIGVALVSNGIKVSTYVIVACVVAVVFWISQNCNKNTVTVFREYVWIKNGLHFTLLPTAEITAARVKPAVKGRKPTLTLSALYDSAATPASPKLLKYLKLFLRCEIENDVIDPAIPAVRP